MNQATKIALGIVIGASVGGCCLSSLALLFRSQPAATPSIATAPAVPAEPAPIAPPPPAEPTPGELFEREFDADALRFAALEGDELAAALEDWSSECTDTSYAMLQRNAAAHFGERVMFSGTIEEIQDTQGGTSVARLSTGGWGRDVLWIDAAHADPHLVARSRARVYGYLSGQHTYESQAGWTITLPSVIAVAVVPATVPLHVSARRREQLGLVAPAE